MLCHCEKTVMMLRLLAMEISRKQISIFFFTIISTQEDRQPAAVYTVFCRAGGLLWFNGTLYRNVVKCH